MTRRGLVAVLVWAAAIGASATWLVRNLVVTADLSAFLPAAATPAQALLVAQLRDGVASRIILAGLEGGDSASLARTSRTLSAALAADPRFAFVTNADLSGLQRERTLATQWRYLLSPAVTAESFTTNGLRIALDEAVRRLASPLAPLVRPTLAADPTGELLRLAPLLAGATPERTLHEGVMFSPDRKRALLVAQTRAPGFDLDAQQDAVRAIREAFARVASPGAQLVLSGPGLVAVESRERIQRDAQVASAVTLGAVVLLLLATYRSAWPTLLSAIPALSGLVIGVVAVGIMFGPVHAITLGFGAMLIGEAIDYPTYLFANNDAGEPLAATQSRIGGTLALAVATTASGALAMLLSGFRGLAQLGLLLLAGVIVAGLVTRYVLPAVTPAGALARKRVAPPIDASRLLAVLRRHAWTAAVAFVLAAGVLLWHRDALWDDDLAHLSPLDVQAKATDRELRTQAGAPDLRHLVVARGGDRDAALAASERVALALDRLVAAGALAGYDHPARYLPSEATQRSRQQALPDAATLERNLRAALAELPFRDDAFAPFAADVERTRAGGLLSREHLEGTAFALKVDSLLSRADGEWTAFLPLVGVADAQAIRDALGAQALLDLKAEADALVAGYRAQSLRSTLLGLACIVLVVYAGVRSLGTTLRLTLPVLGAVLLTAATLLALGEKLTIFHLVSMLLVVGVGLNYALFFGRAHASAAQRDLALLSVGVAGLATLCAACTLALSGTPVLRAIGLTTGIGALFAFFTAAMLASE